MLGRLTNAELRALLGPNEFTDEYLTELGTRLAVLAEIALAPRHDAPANAADAPPTGDIQTSD